VRSLLRRLCQGRSHETSTRGGLRNRLRDRLRDRQSKGKEKRFRLIGQHYKIDQNNRVLLPGVPKYEEDLTRDVHDFFNLILLVSLVCARALCKGIRYIGYQYCKVNMNMNRVTK